MNIKKCKSGEIIIAEGTYGQQTYLIVEGQVMIAKEVGGTSRIPITVLGEGEVFGEMYLFEDAGSRSASVVAQSDVVLQVISKEEMEKHLAETPSIVLSIIKTLSMRLAQTSQENSVLKYKKNGGFLKRLFSNWAGS